MPKCTSPTNRGKRSDAERFRGDGWSRDARVPSAGYTISQERDGEVVPLEVAGQLHTAMTSSRVKCRRMSRGMRASSKWQPVFLSLLSEPFRGSPYETIFYSIVMLLTILFLPGGLITLPGKLAGLRRWRTASAPSPSPAA